MATATMSAAIRAGDFDRVVLHGVRWSTYEALLDDLDGCHIRLTYDRGRLEIMTKSAPHEWSKTLLARAFEEITLELDIPIRSGGEQTFRQELLEKGLEPDECYWIQHEPEVRGKRDISLETDPPPDLAMEIEISMSVLDRLGIYAALRVPEIWRVLMARRSRSRTSRTMGRTVCSTTVRRSPGCLWASWRPSSRGAIRWTRHA